MFFLTKIITISTVCALSLLLSACTNPTKNLAGNSGYFSSYEGFIKPVNGGVDKVRGKSGAAFSQELAKYNKFMINPIIVWKNGNEDRFQNIAEEDLKYVTDLFRQELIDAIGDAYQVVDQPGAGVLQLDVALTGIVASNPELDGALIVVPFMPFITKTEELLTGNQSYVGATSIEGTMRDSQSGEEIIAFIDTRVGKRIYEISADDSLSDPYRYSKKAFEWWSSRLRFVLDTAHTNQ